MISNYKCTFGLEEYKCDVKANDRFAWTVQRYCSSIYRHRSQPVTNYNYAPCESLQHWLRPICIKRSFYLYVGLKRRSSMKRDLRPSLGDDFSRSCFFVWDLRRTEARPQHTWFSELWLKHCTQAHVYTFDHISSIWYKIHVSCSSCAKAKTNVLSSVFL
jgi:hypothetical protein